MMARAIAVVSGLLLLLLFAADPKGISALEGTVAEVERADALPASLDLLYPPRSESPVLTLSMHGMNAALTGIMVDLFEQDWSGVVANFEAFRVRYEETSRMVPEWAASFSAEPVDQLGRAIAGSDADAILNAVESVGAVCHHCHVERMVPVQQKYHWPDFGLIALHDPVLGKDLEYPQFMQMLNLSLTGIGVDLEQGQPEQARSHAASLRARMAELADTCDGCHDSERAYFVDQKVVGLIAQMEEALDAPQPDPATVARLGQALGEQSCFGCHLVHLPAAYARHSSAR